MLDDELVRKIRKMIGSGQYSQRAISRITGVSRVVVHRIATGKRKERPERRKEEWEVDWNGMPYGRCPKCGARVQLPCLACIVRNYCAISCAARFRDARIFSTELELEEKHRIRYEQVRSWRESQKNPDFAEIPEDWPFRMRRTKCERKNNLSAGRE